MTSLEKVEIRLTQVESCLNEQVESSRTKKFLELSPFFFLQLLFLLLSSPVVHKTKAHGPEDPVGAYEC